MPWESIQLRKVWKMPDYQNIGKNGCSGSRLNFFGSIIVLPALMWSCLCLNQHSETGTARFCIMTARVGSFIMYPFLTEKKAFAPGKKEVSYCLSSSLYHPLPHMASEPTYTKFPLPSTYVPERSPTPNYFLPAVVCPLLRITFHLCMAWIQWRKEKSPAPMQLFAMDLGFLSTGPFAS